MFDQFLQDLRHGLHVLRRNPGFTAAAVLMLALGIGANTAIFSVLDSVVARANPFQNPDRTVSISEVKRDAPGATQIVSGDLYALWKDRVGTAFDELGGYRFLYLNISGRDQPEQVQGLTVTASFLSLLGARMQLGRGLLPDEEHKGSDKVAVLSDGLWRRRYGTEANIVGQNITIDGEPYRVVGVLSPAFHFIRVLNRPLDLYIPLVTDPDLSKPLDRNLFVYGRLKRGVSIAQATAQLDSVYRALDAQRPAKSDSWAPSITRLDYGSFFQRTTMYPLVLLLLGAVGLVLLIACANVASLLLARATFRRKEMAVRAAIGAGGRRLFRQMLTESVLLAAIGEAVGILVAIGGIRLLNEWVPDMMIRKMVDFELNASVLAFSLLMSLLSALIFGVVPAFQSSSIAPNEALKESGRQSAGARTHRGSNFLVVSQVALSMVLLTSALLLMRSSLLLQGMSRGLDLNNVFTMKITLPPGKYGDGRAIANFYQDVLQRIHRLPALQSASAINFPPLAIQSTVYPARVEDGVEPPDQPVVSQYSVVSPEYFRTMKIPVVLGREFNEGDVDEKHGVAIVSARTARRLWGDANPIGRRIRPEFPNEKLFWIPDSRNLPLTVIGVVGDIRADGGVFQRPEIPLIYLPYLQNPSPIMHLIVRTASNPLGSANIVRDQVWAVDKNQPVADIATMDDIVAFRFVTERVSADLVSVFAAAAVFLTSIGIYGLLSYSVGRRRHDIAIRMALGARRSDVSRSVLKEAIVLALFGVVLGSVLFLGLRKSLASFLYGVSSTDPAALILVGLSLIVIALVAAYIPARKAMRLDPIVALRDD
jgi:putative ABC transport system permease protein